jgi:hypothetical protein
MKRFVAAMDGLRAMARRERGGRKHHAKRQISGLSHSRNLRLERLEDRALLSNVPIYAAPVGDSPAPVTAATTADWTVLIYLDGDNNLDGAGVFNVNQMESVTYPAGGSVKVAVQFDRAYDADWTETRRALIVHDTNTSTMTSFTGSNYTSIGEADMGLAASLTSFIQWGVATYPASHYVLDLWDHGGGLDGVCWDDTNGSNLTLQEVRQAITNSGTHIDVIGFDACLMGMEEVAHEIRGVGDVMVASEELVPGDGFPYDAWLASLAATPTMTASQLGADLVQKYGAYYDPYTNDTTMSAVNLANESALATSLSSFAQAATNCAEWSTITAARNASHNYYGADYIDLGTFLQYVGVHATDATLRSSANSAYTSYQAAIIQNYSGSVEGATGLSIYLPAQGGSIRSDYTAANFLFVNDTQWKTFLTAYVVYDPLHNDNFTNRTDLGSVNSVSMAGTNVSYTGQSGEPAQSGTINSAWWKWTAPSAGSLTVNTNGSGFDTFLTLATGPAVNALNVLTQDDDGGSGVQSLITWTVVAGTQYQIAVDGYEGDTGSIVLNLAFTPATAVGVAVSPQSVTEDGTPNLIYTFTRTGTTTAALTVNFTVGGTSAFNVDYTQTGAATFTGTAGTVIIPSGSSTAAVTLNPTADTTVEPDETALLTVVAGTGYAIGTPTSATGTITNDDKTNITISDVTLAEGSAGGTTAFTFTVSSSNAVASSVTVNYATADGTATEADSDYTAASGTVTFTAGGALTKTVTVYVTQDGKVEANETFYVNLSNAKFGGVADATRAAITDSQALGTITNDDVSPTVSIAAVAPSLRVTPLGSIAIQFSKPIVGFDLADLQLTRDGVSVSLTGATLTTTDQQNWTLGNLAGITSPIGIYQLTLTATGSGIADQAGNPLLVGSSTVWRIVAPIPGDFNLDGVVDNLDKTIWYAHAFTGTTWAQGDANGDGTVNGLDRDILFANLGRSIYLEYPAPAPSLAQGKPALPAAPMNPSPLRPEGLTPVRAPTSPAPLASNGSATGAQAASVSSRAAALRAAHDLLFNQLEHERYSVVDGLLDDGVVEV